MSQRALLGFAVFVAIAIAICQAVDDARITDLERETRTLKRRLEEWEPGRPERVGGNS
jgi:hypothetical protein